MALAESVIDRPAARAAHHATDQVLDVLRRRGGDVSFDELVEELAGRGLDERAALKETWRLIASDCIILTDDLQLRSAV